MQKQLLFHTVGPCLVSRRLKIKLEREPNKCTVTVLGFRLKRFPWLSAKHPVWTGWPLFQRPKHKHSSSYQNMFSNQKYLSRKLLCTYKSTAPHVSSVQFLFSKWNCWQMLTIVLSWHTKKERAQEFIQVILITVAPHTDLFRESCIWAAFAVE